MALLLFVNEAHWRRRNEKQNRSNRDQQSRAFAEHSQSIRRTFAERSQNIRRDFEAENLFFEELKTRSLVFFGHGGRKKMRKQGPGSRRDVLKFLEISLASIGIFTIMLNSCAPRATFLKA